MSSNGVRRRSKDSLDVGNRVSLLNSDRPDAASWMSGATVVATSVEMGLRFGPVGLPGWDWNQFHRQQTSTQQSLAYFKDLVTCHGDMVCLC